MNGICSLVSRCDSIVMNSNADDEQVFLNLPENYYQKPHSIWPFTLCNVAKTVIFQVFWRFFKNLPAPTTAGVGHIECPDNRISIIGVGHDRCREPAFGSLLRSDTPEQYQSDPRRRSNLIPTRRRNDDTNWVNLAARTPCGRCDRSSLLSGTMSLRTVSPEQFRISRRRVRRVGPNHRRFPQI